MSLSYDIHMDWYFTVEIQRLSRYPFSPMPLYHPTVRYGYNAKVGRVGLGCKSNHYFDSEIAGWM